MTFTTWKKVRVPFRHHLPSTAPRLDYLVLFSWCQMMETSFGFPLSREILRNVIGSRGCWAGFSLLALCVLFRHSLVTEKEGVWEVMGWGWAGGKLLNEYNGGPQMSIHYISIICELPGGSRHCPKSKWNREPPSKVIWNSQNRRWERRRSFPFCAFLVISMLTICVGNSRDFERYNCLGKCHYRLIMLLCLSYCFVYLQTAYTYIHINGVYNLFDYALPE